MDSVQATVVTTIRIITIVAIIFGLIGNVITCMVFSRKTFLKNSISLYSRAIAVFDSFIIYVLIVYFYLALYNYNISAYSDFTCKLNYFILYSFGSIPGWIIIAFSFDKILSLKKVAANRMVKPLIHYMIILGIVVINFLIYIEIPIFMVLVPVKTGWACNPSYLDFGVSLNDIVVSCRLSLCPFRLFIR